MPAKGERGAPWSRCGTLSAPQSLRAGGRDPSWTSAPQPCCLRGIGCKMHLFLLPASWAGTLGEGRRRASGRVVGGWSSDGDGGSGQGGWWARTQEQAARVRPGKGPARGAAGFPRAPTCRDALPLSQGGNRPAQKLPERGRALPASRSRHLPRGGERRRKLWAGPGQPPDEVTLAVLLFPPHHARSHAWPRAAAGGPECPGPVTPECLGSLQQPSDMAKGPVGTAVLFRWV